MKKHTNVKLDKDEKELLRSIESGEWQSVKNLEEMKAMAKEAASYTLKKDARVNIRLPSIDLMRIKRTAAFEGIPYQTLIASILHKYSAGHFPDRKN